MQGYSAGAWNRNTGVGTGESDAAVLDLTLLPGRSFSGTYDDGTTLGTAFAGYTQRSGHLVADLDGVGYLAGHWVRIKGKRGVFMAAEGTCDGAAHPSDALQGWYPESLASWTPASCNVPPGTDVMLLSQSDVDAVLGCSVLGNVDVFPSPTLVSLVLPQLTSASRVLVVSSLSQLRLPRLETLGLLQLSGPSLQDVQFPRLSSVATVYISRGDFTFYAPELLEITRSIRVQSNEPLELVDVQLGVGEHRIERHLHRPLRLHARAAFRT